MATFKIIDPTDIKSTRSVLNQLIDYVEEDISGSATRKKYKVFVTGSSGSPGVTSSLYHTIYDQDYSLQTANELFDMTVGIFSGSASVTAVNTGQDINGKMLFTSESCMMREKINVYRQFAQLLLGDATSKFTSPFSNPSSGGEDDINEALFLTYKRLFVRDGIKRETFAMKWYQSGSDAHNGLKANLSETSESGSAIYTDVGSATSIEMSQNGGEVGNLLDSSNTARSVGLLFYDAGIAVLDLNKVCSASQHMSGTIAADGAAGGLSPFGGIVEGLGTGAPGAKFIPDFICSASMDDILDHLASTRVSSGTLTSMTFQNETWINSSLIFCRATADEFNYSSNPTYTDTDGRIVVIDETQQGIQKSFSFVTSVGLYDSNEELLAISKLSRPVEKNDGKDLTFRVRLDF